MAYGLSFEGRLGNSCFSDETPSMVFMGVATKTSNYGTRTSYVGSTNLNVNNYGGGRCSSSHTTSLSHTAGSGNTFNLYHQGGTNVWHPGYYTCSNPSDPNSNCYWHPGWCSLSQTAATSTVSFTDNARTLDYEIESYDKPTIFIEYKSPTANGGLVVKTVNKGVAGSTYGYSVWTITVLLYYSSTGASTTAADQISLYCFSKVHPSYSSSNWGLHIKDSSGDTMFHSDWKPCHIKEVMTITTGTNPATNFSSTLVDATGARMPSKPCYLSQDWGRLYSYVVVGPSSFRVRLELMQFPYSVQYISGDDFATKFGQINASDYAVTSTAKSEEFKGASTVVWPIIDGADYD